MRRSVAAASLGALWLTMPASAALDVAVTSSPAQVRFGVTERVAFSVVLSATGQDETFRLGFRSRGFGVVDGEQVEGSPLAFDAQTLDLRGGEVLGPASVTYGVPGCSPRITPHGSDHQSRTWDVRVAAGATAVATLPFRVLTISAPWPDTSYGLTVFADRGTESPSTLARPITVSAPGPAIVGPRAVHIVLASVPRTGGFGRRGNPTLGRRESVRINGRTTPPVRHSHIAVTVSGGPRVGPQTSRRLSVPTDHDGRFTIPRLRFGHAGSFGVGAEYRNPRPGSPLGDYACPLGFFVR